MALFIKKLKGKKTLCPFSPGSGVDQKANGKRAAIDAKYNSKIEILINVVNELTDNERAERATAHLALVRYKG